MASDSAAGGDATASSADQQAKDIFFDCDDDDNFHEAESLIESNLVNLVGNKTLKWIFVGGKGGVGKTTCSCSIAAILSHVRRNVLILSTDPAHNVSDAFRQKFTKVPTLVQGYRNLFAMELDAAASVNERYEEDEEIFGEQAGGMFGFLKKYTHDLMASMPGVDEAMSYAEVMKLVQSMDFDVVVFDTAPTGHTLRLLNMPDVIERGLSRILSIKNRVMPFVSRIGGMMGYGGGGADGEDSLENVPQRIEEVMPIVQSLQKQFRDPQMTTFVCVCIAEFLSVYETERLIQALVKFGINSHNIIINQLIPPPPPTEAGADEQHASCRLCVARRRLQNRYVEQLECMYDEFHIVKVPLLEDEVHGKERIESFAKRLMPDGWNPDSSNACANAPST